MQRFDNESFDAYKERRRAANLAVKRLNWNAKGGTVGARQQLRSAKKSSGVELGGYGAAILASIKPVINPSIRRKNQKAFARRIASSLPAIKPPSARQERIARKAEKRAVKAVAAIAD